MRKLIAGMKISLDGKMTGPEGTPDWVEAWSEDYGLMPQIDACILGGGMYPGYEWYWSSIQSEPEKAIWITEKPPTPAEIAWARFIAETPHYVLSKTITSSLWPKTRFLTEPKQIAALKQQPGKDIYLIGGGKTTTSLMDAGLVDELRLLVYPLVSGEGERLFDASDRRHRLGLRHVEQRSNGLISLVYDIN